MENKDIILKEEMNLGKKIISTKKCKTKEEKIKLFNALQHCDYLLVDCEDKIIEIKDIYIEAKDVLIDDEVKEKYRIIIFDKDDVSYATGSYGIYNKLCQIVTVFGNPEEWNEPLKCKVIKIATEDKKTMLSLELIA